MTPVKDRTAKHPRRGRPSRGVRAAVLAATRDLIREEGLTGATTSAIAERAGASEASIHYHFGGKAALLEAAVVEALQPVREHRRASQSSVPQEVLELARSLERSYDDLVPVLAAVQSDPVLRETVGPRLLADDLGPHRAVTRVAAALSEGDTRGGEEGDTDAEAAALLLVGAAFIRAWQRQMSPGVSRTLPSLTRAVTVLLDCGAGDEQG